MKAMLLSAGLGTRLKPFTDNNPKCLLPINGITLLERNIKYLKKFGIDEIVINVHHFKDKIIKFIQDNNSFGVTIHISQEVDELLETGGGLVKAKHHFNSDFVLFNSDILTDLNLSEMIKFHYHHKPIATLAVSDRESSRKLMFDKEMSLCGWKNLNTGEQVITNSQTYNMYAFSGVHIISPQLFDYLPSEGKFSIMTSYIELMKSRNIKGYIHYNTQLVDVGKPYAIPLAEQIFK